MSVEVKNVTKIYGEQKALDEISFSVEPGNIVGFLGPNGAGKSTMMKIITCFIPQTSGSVSVCGYDVIENPIDVKRQVGYLPEHNPLYLDMYVKEYLDFVGGVYKIDKRKDRVKEMIDMVGLGIEQNKKIGALSKGYRQRVGLAQAMIHDPKVLILDEPTTGLHFADVDRLTKVLHHLVDLGNSVIVIEHNLDVVRNADYVIDMGYEGGAKGGQIIATGTPEEIASTHKETKSYTGYYLEKQL